MAMNKHFWAALVACAVPVSGVCRADEPVDAPLRRGGEPRPFTVRLPDAFGEHSFWIGAMCMPVDPALRAQLGLNDHEGLVVSNIMPESPAAKAGLKQFDVLTAVDGKPLGSLHALMKVVGDAGEKPLKLDIVRGGKKESLTITPAKRPDRDMLLFNAPLGPEGPQAGDPRRMQEHLERLQKQFEQMREKLPEGEVKRMEEWLERMQRGENLPFRMQVFGPGVVMQQMQAGGLPAGVSVSIKREGNQAANIHVERGDEKWDVDENELDKLPADLRGPIGAMLVPGGAVMIQRAPGGGAAAATVAGGSNGAGNVQIEIKTDEQNDKPIVVAPGTPAGQGPLLEEVEKLRKQVEALQKQVDSLKRTQEKPADPQSPKKDKPRKE